MVTADFIEAARLAKDRASHSPDAAVRYAANHVPILAQVGPTPDQAQAGGCPTCTYLGLWANKWPGLGAPPHGIIWLFEDGIRKCQSSLDGGTYATLLHEIDHALQRDHVLQAMGIQNPAQVRQAQEAAALRVAAWSRPGG